MSGWLLKNDQKYIFGIFENNHQGNLYWARNSTTFRAFNLLLPYHFISLHLFPSSFSSLSYFLVICANSFSIFTRPPTLSYRPASPSPPANLLPSCHPPANCGSPLKDLSSLIKERCCEFVAGRWLRQVMHYRLDECLAGSTTSIWRSSLSNKAASKCIQPSLIVKSLNSITECRIHQVKLCRLDEWVGGLWTNFWHRIFSYIIAFKSKLPDLIYSFTTSLWEDFIKFNLLRQMQNTLDNSCLIPWCQT